MDHSVRLQLATELARLYRADASVQSVLDAAGIRNQELISWADRSLDTWFAVLNHVGVQEQMRDLLDVVIAQFPQDAVFHRARREELLRPQPKIPLSPTAAPLLDLGTAEQLMGDESTLLPISFLKHGLECARAVARTVNGRKTASGFLTDGDIFVTNHHVIASENEAEQTTLEFGYDAHPDNGSKRQFTAVALRPESGFHTDPGSDITLVRAEPGTSKSWGRIPVEDFDLAGVRYVNIIQHPQGAPKMIGLYHNVLAYHDDRIIDYYTDTLPGSSGSPVLDSAWRLVGVHRGTVYLDNPRGSGTVYRNSGTSISTVAALLSRLR